MQKKLIAMAVAGLVAAPAFAQVTMSGRVDLGVRFDSNDKDSKLSVNSGQYTTSRVTLAASEDLGGGMKAAANLEMAFNADNGTGGGGSSGAGVGSTGALDGSNGGFMFNRVSQAGLSGGFGTVMLGRNWTPTHLWGYAIAMMPQGATTWEPGYMLSRGTYTTNMQNSIEYTSPKLGPVEIRVQYGAAETSRSEVDATRGNTSTTDDKSKKGSLAFGARGSFGPANLFLGVSNINTAANTTDNLSEQMTFGGNVNLGMVTPFFHFQSTTNTATALNGGAETETEATVFSVGAKVKVGANGAVAAQYAARQDSAGGKDTTEATGLSVSYEHNMSKRTRLYAAYGMVDNDNGGMQNLGYANTKANESNSTLALGVIHFF